ncbi:uncharacterized protein J3R85_017921 [Psidium guajava]|nr:uncharacterized protein J3R85_017921 [Psidium guajava]
MSVDESTFVDDQLNSGLLFLGQPAAAILGKFYLDEGGKSKLLAFPVVYLPPFLLPLSPKNFNPLTRTAGPFTWSVLSACIFG